MNTNKDRMIKRGVLFLVLTIFTVSWSFAQVKIKDIVWDKTEHDFGELEFGAPKFTVVFTFTNNGTADFQISRVHTSCNCTEAKWPGTIIKPGAKGVVSATFSPQGLSGDIDKPIEVFGNFTDGHSMILHITGKIERPELPVMQNDTTFYPGQFGYIRFNQYNLYFGSVANNSTVTRTFLVVNDFNQPLSIKSIKPSKPYISCSASQLKIEPGDTAKVDVTIDASAVKDLGELTGDLVIETNDLFYPNKSMQLYFNVQYAFEDTKRAKRRAPKIYIPNKKVDMGNMNEGGKKEGTFTVMNNGRSDLKILKVVNNCSCTVIENYPDVIKKGESVELTVQFDALFKHGPQNKVLTLFTNDPLNPTIDITVSAMVHGYE